MKKKKIFELPLDKFINFSLYNKNNGYYMKKKSFGKDGDFTTAPNISRLFSEMIAIWIISFWQSIGSPKKFNLIELGAGNGEMMKTLIESFERFPNFFRSCNFFIFEKSPSLVEIQKNKLNKNKIKWILEINKINKNPCLFIANEFFDSLAIKQFKKKQNIWYERYVNFEDKDNAFFFEKEIDIKKIEKKINYKISKNQNFIEFSQLGFNYLKKISNIIKKYNGGLLIIDYGYNDKKMRNTLQAISDHKFSKVLKNIFNTDITHNINFHLLKEIALLNGLHENLTTQKNFLINMGIKQRAYILSKNLSFSEKTNIYYRLERLINEKQMGTLFKVMLIKNKKNKFSLGF